MSQYQPVPFKPIKYLKQGGLERKFTLFWLLSCLVIIPSGMITILLEWTGLTLNIFGLSIHITIYLPMLICLPMALIFGFLWAAIPAYFATFFVALIGDMSIFWIVIFSFANPIGLAMLVLVYKVTLVNFSLRTKASIIVYVVAVFLSSLAGSIGSFIWTYTNQSDLYDFFKVWQGWWLGGFMQAVLISAPFLYLIEDRVMVFKNHCFEGISTKTESRRTIKYTILLITLVLISYTWLAFQIGVMNIKDQIRLITGADQQNAILNAISVIEFPILIYVFILAFIGYFVFYFIDYWTLRLEKANAVLQEQNEKLYQLSISDNLTRIYNRGYLFSHLPELIASLKASNDPIAFMLLDLDHFKVVNDSFGHQAGDEVLQQFSKLVKDKIKQGQVFARFGGEEFILVAPKLNQADALSCAQELNELTKDMQVNHKGQPISVTVSVGVYVTRNLKQSVDHMIDEADKALYQAKKNGRDQVVIVSD